MAPNPDNLSYSNIIKVSNSYYILMNLKFIVWIIASQPYVLK
nr:MAG TPA_asm: hypothetical protein [Caudoviricetes sp.]